MLGLVVSVVRGLGLDRREIVAVLEGSAVVVPVDPFGGGDLDIVDVADSSGVSGDCG